MEEIKPNYVGLVISAILGTAMLIVLGLLTHKVSSYTSQVSVDMTKYFFIIVCLTLPIFIIHELSILYQYYSLESNRKIYIDSSKNRIIIRNKKFQDEIIEFNDINRIILNNKPFNSRSLSRDLEYSQLCYGNNRTLLLTSLRIDNESLKKKFSIVTDIVSKERKALSRIKIY